MNKKIKKANNKTIIPRKEYGLFMHNNYLYVKIEQKNSVNNKKVLLKDIAKIYSQDSAIEKNVGEIIILTIDSDKEQSYYFSIMKIIDMVMKKNPNIKIINMGETDFIIKYQPVKTKKKIAEIIKVVLICLILFIGAAFTIMTFNTDVSVGDLFSKIYKLVLEKNQKGYKVLEISYSIGIGIGIIVFFNHFSKNKRQNDPTPIEVELRTYEKEINEALLENASRINMEEDT